jgi:A/G-specific adenine glycosylase
MNISKVLIKWYFQNKRELPWRDSFSPYKIWLSEIILQQTRVDQGLDYYLKFIQCYPDVIELSEASLDEILKIWQGLGYYSRARHLHETAKKIVHDYNGRFPEYYSELIKLKGIGPYTAAAIASIAFNEPVAVTDGNVFRFLARYFGLAIAAHTSEGKMKFSKLATSILDHNNPGTHNQAMMEFGAVQCTPSNPVCTTCPLRDTCYARSNNMIKQLPVKKRNVILKERFFNYLVITSKKRIFLRKRVENDIWKMLYEFPLIEVPWQMSEADIMNSSNWKQILDKLHKIDIRSISKPYKQILTHQRIYARFFRMEIEPPPSSFLEKYLSVDIELLQDYAVPKLIERYLLDCSILHPSFM